MSQNCQPSSIVTTSGESPRTFASPKPPPPLLYSDLTGASTEDNGLDNGAGSVTVADSMAMPPHSLAAAFYPVQSEVQIESPSDHIDPYSAAAAAAYYADAVSLQLFFF